MFDDQAIRQLADIYGGMEPEISAMHTALEYCIDGLQGRPRKLLEMRYVRDLTPGKIAAMTGMNSNAVSVMLHRVRRNLRECIERRLAARPDANAAGGAI